jgi:WhiB family redox-sensing transcriptional regulator
MSARPYTPIADRGDSWRDQGRCAEVDPMLFYPAKGESANPARMVCAGCEVRDQCLEWALATDQRWGVWGGTTEHDRRKIKRDRQDVA